MEETAADIPVRSFASAAEWESRLSAHHAQSRGLWVQIAKKGAGVPSVTYDEALDAALCYGWIDGQKRTHDERFFLQKFTPRRPRSLWSKRNVGKVGELVAAGRMRPAGHAEVEAAQRDGRWAAAYDSPKDMAMPEDFIAAVRRDEGASALYDTLGRSQLYGIAFRLHNVRTSEERERRFKALLESLSRGEKLSL